MELHLDLETIPTRRLDVMSDISDSITAETKAAIDAVKPPSNYKAATQEKWWDEVGTAKLAELRNGSQALVESAVRKTSLSGNFGNICVIGWAFDDEDAQYLASDKDEAALLTEFHETLKARLRPADGYLIRVVGHNVAAFDLRFFMQRSMVHGIKPHFAISRAANAKPWESTIVFDTMLQWAGIGNRIKLDTLCKALGVDSPKGELDGSKVWDWVRDGRIKEVGEYCMKDVAATRAVFKRMVYQT